MATKFKALSTPVRLTIFQELTRCCEPGSTCEVQRCIGDLASLVNVAPSTLSHHMKALNHAGLVDMERVGKNIFCRVNPSALTLLSSYFKS
ncbi:MAG: metalloregulator ArsR/SmtB family transcription factor [Ghiorsea sp.]